MGCADYDLDFPLKGQLFIFCQQCDNCQLVATDPKQYDGSESACRLGLYTFRSQDLLMTTHELSSTVREYMEVFIENIFSKTHCSISPSYLTLRLRAEIKREGEERSQQWLIGGDLDVVAAAATAALEQLLG